MNHLTAPEVTLAGILIVSATHHTRLHMEFSTVPIVLVQKKKNTFQISELNLFANLPFIFGVRD